MPPHPPTGRFAPKLSGSPLLLLSAIRRLDLPLSRTMLTGILPAYVDRFACDWPRLSTTDPVGQFHIICLNLADCKHFFHRIKRFFTQRLLCLFHCGFILRSGAAHILGTGVGQHQIPLSDSAQRGVNGHGHGAKVHTDEGVPDVHAQSRPV